MSIAQSIADTVGSALSGVADTVGSVVESVGSFVTKTIDSAFNDPVKTAAMIAAAIYLGPEVAMSDIGAMEAAEASASSFFTVPAGSIVDGAVVQGGMSIPASSIATAVSTSAGQVVTTYGAEGLASAITGGFVAPATTLSTALLNGTAGPGMWSTTLDALNTAKTVVQTKQLIETATGKKSVVPLNSPVPTGYTIDAAYVPPTTTAQGQAVNTPIVQPTTTGSTVSAVATLAALAGVVYFLGIKK
jgi:hypothetical protein